MFLRPSLHASTKRKLLVSDPTGTRKTTRQTRARDQVRVKDGRDQYCVIDIDNKSPLNFLKDQVYAPRKRSTSSCSELNPKSILSTSTSRRLNQQTFREITQAQVFSTGRPNTPKRTQTLRRELNSPCCLSIASHTLPEHIFADA